jgi:hypothetical protein
LNGFHDLRVFEFAHPPKLLALHATRIVWVALDLLFSASDASYGQPLSRLPGFRDTPMGIDNLTINHRLAVGSIVVKVTHSFTWYFGLANKTR